MSFIRRNKALAAFAFLTLLASGPFAGPVAAQPDGMPRVVVELFTSQGCYSCPPAEAILGELADRDDVLALEFHVDYWDYIGWKDPFASAAFTERQRAYRSALNARYVYTPQMVIDGRMDEVGSRRMAVEKKIRAAYDAKHARPTPIVSLTRAPDGAVTVRVAGAPDGKEYEIILAAFDNRHSTEVPRGENAGKVLISRHVVRGFRKLGDWIGGPAEQTVALDGAMQADGLAVLIQEKDYGPIIANALLRPGGS